MARALEEQWTLPASHSLSFDERLGLLLDRELAWRDNQRLVRLRKKAKLKYANACLEDLDRRSGRALDERLIATLASGDWIRPARLGWPAPWATRPAARAIAPCTCAPRACWNNCASLMATAASAVPCNSWQRSTSWCWTTGR